MNPAIVHLGADLAQAHIDLHGPLPGLPERLANDKASITRLLKQLAKHPNVQIVCEASGGCERELRRACQRHGVALSVVNPHQVYAFGQAKGQRAKTDRLDARLLCEYGQTMRPAVTPPLEPAAQKLAALSTRRRQLVRLRAMEKNRLLQAEAFLAASHRQTITFFDRQIARLDEAMAQIVSACARLQSKVATLSSVKGVGSASAIALLAALPELGSLSKSQAAALAGLAPFNRDSGTFRGQRHVRGGRTAVRDSLYMCAVTAARCNPIIKAFYQRLRQHGKPAKLALTAAMRKLLIHLNARLKHLPSPA